MQAIQLLVLCGSMASMGCHVYYVPSQHNVPLLVEQDEFHGTATIGGGHYTGGLEFQGAYSPTEKLRVIGGFMSTSHGSTSSSDSSAGTYLEAGIGHCELLGGRGQLGILGGYGHSFQKHFYGSYKSASVQYSKPFVQGWLGVTFDAGDVALSLRMANIRFHQVDHNLRSPGSDLADLQELQSSNYLLLEPAATVRLGWKYFKLHGQLGKSYNLTETGLLFEDLHVNLGFSICIASRFRGKSG